MELSRALRSGGYVHDQLRPGLSAEAYTELVRRLSVFTARRVERDVLKAERVSEWGALLLREEMLRLVKMLDEVLHDDDERLIVNTNTAVAASSSSSSSSRSLASASASASASVSMVFTRMLWITRLLTLDRPADVQRYALPLLSDDEISQPHHHHHHTHQHDHHHDELLEEPSHMFSESEVRSVMALRYDFSREAVQRVRLSR